MIRYLQVAAPPDPAGDATSRRTHELVTLHHLGRAVARSLDEHEILEQALEALIGMGWYACGEAFTVDDGGEPATVAVGACPHDRVGDCPLRPDLLPAARDAVRGGEVALRSGWWLVPIERRALLALAARPEAGDVSDAFLRATVELVASALRRATLHGRLVEKERQRARLLSALLHAQEEERARISRDLHDQVGQALTGVLLGLDAFGEKAEADRAELDRLKELTATTLADVRRIALDLRPSVLDELGLEAAVRRLARDVHARHGIDAQVAIRLPRLDSRCETILYRVAQEALTNVVRHARAGAVSVVATLVGDQVQLVVEDDGVGFDGSALDASDRLGLDGMRERLELRGGSLRVESAPGRGTTVYARLPRRLGSMGA